jgi:hypothetical protein
MRTPFGRVPRTLSTRPIVPHAKGIQDVSPGVSGPLPFTTTNAGITPNLSRAPLTPSLSRRERGMRWEEFTQS